MLNLTTQRFGLITVFTTFCISVCWVHAQDRSVLDSPIVDPALNQPGNSLFKIPTEDVEAPVPPGQETQELTSPSPDENVEQMTRGPLHEAFAEVQLDEPVPGGVLSKQPPEPINELPPQYKPEGENIEWIPGYWAWDEERTDYFWISGIWRDVPPGQRWVPGYWETADEGFRWVSGFWMDAKVEEIDYLPPPPVTLENGPSTPAPSEQHFYSPGNWIYQTNDYVWQPGCWMPRVSDWVWVPACYVWTPRGCVFRPGYWDRLFDCRGLVFSPICYRRPVYLDVGYYYTPSCVIHTNFNLLPHLFVRRNCRSYYFGDWYDHRYIDHDFCAWSQITARPRYRNCYDPFFTYYNYSAIQYNQVSLISWVRNQNDQCLHQIDRRPARTFNVQININNQHNHINQTVINNQPVVIADTLERRVKTTVNRSGRPETFQRLGEAERHSIQKQADPILTIARDRREIEKVSRKGTQNPLPAGNTPPVLTEQTSRKTKLELPKVDRKQIESAERSAAELKRQQERQDREAQSTARRQANQSQATTQNPVLQKATDLSRSRGKLAGGNQIDGGTGNGQPDTTADKAVLRKLDAERRQSELKSAQQQKEIQREVDRQKATQERNSQRNSPAQDRVLRNNQSPLNNSNNPPNLNNRDLERDQRKTQNQQHLQLQQQQQQQQQLEAQRRRANEQAAQKAAQQQRDAELATRRQVEAQERSMRQQRESQDRVLQQQQDQMRNQQRRAQEDAARQQRELERQQQRDGRKKK